MADGDNLPLLSHVEPILPVKNIVDTVNYWHDVLGFYNKWTWGDPPNHGGVTWQGVFIQFSLNPKLASASKGNAIFIRVKKIAACYKFHQNKKAEIVAPLENKPWGLAEYTVRELNDYYIVFSGGYIFEKEKALSTVAEKLTIISRTPTVKEYSDLVVAVGWGQYNDLSLADKILAAPVYAVVAEDPNTSQAVGCALVLSDGAGFYYIKDLMVHPAWQKKRVGSMLMEAITDWMDASSPGRGHAYLFTGERLAPFYKQFDFAPAFGMVREVKPGKNKKN
jgi:GNAT superfamily N-acetyltransferase